MTTDYTDLIAALHLPIHGAQQEWTCRKAAHALAALTIERDASNKLAVQAFAKAEALAGEVESLKHDVARHMQIANEVTAERDRLKAALETVRQYVKGGPDHVSDDDITAVFSVVDAALRAAGDGR